PSLPVFVSLTTPPPTPPLFPYTTLFRSLRDPPRPALLRPTGVQAQPRSRRLVTPSPRHIPRRAAAYAVHRVGARRFAWTALAPGRSCSSAASPKVTCSSAAPQKMNRSRQERHGPARQIP